MHRRSTTGILHNSLHNIIGHSGAVYAVSGRTRLRTGPRESADVQAENPRLKSAESNGREGMRAAPMVHGRSTRISINALFAKFMLIINGDKHSLLTMRVYVCEICTR